MSEDPYILCPVCHRRSYNLKDIENRYCGYCHDFLPPEPTGRPHEFATPGAFCPTCFHPWESCITKSGAPPTKGTLTVCLGCGEAAIFTSHHGYQPVTHEVATMLQQTKPALYEMLKQAQAKVRQSRQ